MQESEGALLPSPFRRLWRASFNVTLSCGICFSTSGHRLITGTSAAHAHGRRNARRLPFIVRGIRY